MDELAKVEGGLAWVNVVHTAYNAVQAITNALMAANPFGFLVIAIAALAAGFVQAYNRLKPFHDAVNTAFVLLKARVTVAGVIVRCQVAVVNMIVRGAFAESEMILCCGFAEGSMILGGGVIVVRRTIMTPTLP
jgi:hypothetical protein